MEELTGSYSALSKRKSSALSSLDEAFISVPIKSTKRRPIPETRTSTTALESLLPPSKTPAIPTTPSNYSPTSLDALLVRLATFKLSTYPTPIPESLNPLSAASNGWINKGLRNRLECVTCSAGFIAIPPTTTVITTTSTSTTTVVVGGNGGNAGGGGWESSIGQRTKKHYEALLRTNGHLSGCPWRVSGCRPSLYRVLAKEGETRGNVIRAFLGRLSTLRDVERIRLDDVGVGKELGEAVRGWSEKSGEARMEGVREEGLVLALLGWSMLGAGEGRMLYCHLCTRKVRLEPFIPSSLPSHSLSSTPPPPSTTTPPLPSTTTTTTTKSFDPIKQHQSFCAYISPPAPPSAALSTTEVPGWKKELAVVLNRQEESGIRNEKSNTKEVMLYVRELLNGSIAKRKK